MSRVWVPLAVVTLTGAIGVGCGEDGPQNPGVDPVPRNRGTDSPDLTGIDAAILERNEEIAAELELQDLVLHTTVVGDGVQLVPGDDRGLITYPLFWATLVDENDEPIKRVFFVLSDTSEEDLSERFNTLWSRALPSVNPAGVEFGGRFEDGQWFFTEDLMPLPYLDDAGEIVRQEVNWDYSPVKQLAWTENGETRTVYVNAPFIKWGRGENQQVIVDTGGCAPNIRANPPSPFFVGQGPRDCSGDQPLEGWTDGFERYRGGQALDLTVDEACFEDDAPQPCGSVTMKLHKGAYRHDVHPYYTVFEATKRPASETMGVPYAPKLAFAGGRNDNPGVANIIQFGNGVQLGGIGGPNRFQPGMVSYGSPAHNNYSPLWHITWGFWDCDEDGLLFSEERNVSFGAAPVPGQGADVNFDPMVPASFDPFQMDDKWVECTEKVKQWTNTEDGLMLNGFRADAIDSGRFVETEAPPGWNGNAVGDDTNPDLQNNLIVNCPTPVTFEPGF